MMELTEEMRAHMFGPWNPYFHVTKVLKETMDRVRSKYTNTQHAKYIELKQNVYVHYKLLHGVASFYDNHKLRLGWKYIGKRLILT